MKKKILHYAIFFTPALLLLLTMTTYVSLIKFFLQSETLNYLEMGKEIVTQNIQREYRQEIINILQDITEMRSKKIISLTIVFCSMVMLIFLIVLFINHRNSKKQNKHLQEIIFRDSVTKFSNWDKFEIDSQYILSFSKNKKFALINFDINKFKVINDMYGTKAGDRVLNHIAECISKVMKTNETFARSNADNFIMLIQFNERQDIIDRIETINKSVLDYDRTIMLSFGVYIIDDRKLDINLINDRAKIAKNKTKGRHDVLYSFYEENIRNNIIREKEIEDQMENALLNREFKVYMQPKFDIIKNKIVGAEALIRWEKNGKVISPGEFMPVFEKNGFVTKIDHFVFEETCRTIKSWIERGITPITVSVNVARLDMHDDTFINNLSSTIKKFGIPIKYVEVEITETTAHNFSTIDLFLDVVNKIKSFGFSLSMDDFGSGYSSLNLLCDLPIDTLKLDKEFLSKNTNIERGESIIADIISMAKHLNMNIVAEGVETQNQVDFLKSVGCSVIQGYYYSKPIPINEFEAKLIQNGGSAN